MRRFFITLLVVLLPSSVFAQITLERGCGRLEWSCLDWNKPSIDFYKFMGAAAMEDWTTYRLTGSTLRKAAESIG